ncbi:MAG: sugar ABC transporter permease [Paracoccaceae bacterium]|nr:sugar ABC transporter permease [Paracoccaceae bacterium]
MTAPVSPRPTRRRLGARLWAARMEYLFMLPGLILFGLLIGYPMVASDWFSLLDWSGFDAKSAFIGLGNYRELWNDPYFWGAFRRSFFFMLGTVPMQMGLSLVLAIVLNNRLMKWAAVFRTAIFLPVVAPVAVTGIVLTLMLSPFNGPVNGLLMSLGVIRAPLDFLGSPDLAMPTLIVVFVWKWIGTTMVYWLAALQTVPDELYEAARLEGVKGWQMTLFVILPIILPFAIVIALVSAISALNVFPLIQSMTGGGPFYATEVMEVYIFRNAFASTAGSLPRLGYASAAGVFFGLAIMVLTLLQIASVRWMRRSTRDV